MCETSPALERCRKLQNSRLEMLADEAARRIAEAVKQGDSVSADIFRSVIASAETALRERMELAAIDGMLAERQSSGQLWPV